jgi:hypothetical protein
LTAGPAGRTIPGMHTPTNFVDLLWLLGAAAAVGFGWVAGCALGAWALKRVKLS